VKSLVRRIPGDSWVDAPYVSQTNPIIVGGCGRSGTTLLSVMLDCHQNLCCGPESRLFASLGMNPGRLADLFHLPRFRVLELIRSSPSKSQFIQRFAAEYSVSRGKMRFAEKTPGNIRSADYIWRHFPKAKIVHVIRDGRDVVCSLRTHPKYKLVRGQRVETGIRRPLDPCIKRWITYVRAGLALRRDPRYCELRYEDLVKDTEGTLRRLMEFLAEPWDPAMLRYHEQKYASVDPRRAVQGPGVDAPIYTSVMGRWRKDLTADERAHFTATAGSLLAELGYDPQ
jgi:hypothetical protein